MQRGVIMYHALEKLEIPDSLLRSRWDINNFFLQHDHDLWEFMVICEGPYRQKINDQEYTMSHRDAVLVKPTDIHQVFPGNPKDYHLNIVISCSFMKAMCQQYDDRLYEKLLNTPNSPFHLHESEFNFIKRLISKIDITNDAKEIVVLKKVLLSYILNQIYEHYYVQTNNYSKPIQKVIEFISLPQNCAYKIEELAKMSGYSYSQLAKLFKEATGSTLTQFYTIQKMEYARELILKTQKNLLEISGIVGYDSFSHFIRVFKKTVGTPPGKYRASLQQ